MISWSLWKRLRRSDRTYFVPQLSITCLFVSHFPWMIHPHLYVRAYRDVSYFSHWFSVLDKLFHFSSLSASLRTQFFLWISPYTSAVSARYDFLEFFITKNILIYSREPNIFCLFIDSQLFTRSTLFFSLEPPLIHAQLNEFARSSFPFCVWCALRRPSHQEPRSSDHMWHVIDFDTTIRQGTTDHAIAS